MQVGKVMLSPAEAEKGRMMACWNDRFYDCPCEIASPARGNCPRLTADCLLLTGDCFRSVIPASVASADTSGALAIEFDLDSAERAVTGGIAGKI